MVPGRQRRTPDPAPSPPTTRRGSRRHNLDAEESLLGAMLLSADAISIPIELLLAEDFYQPVARPDLRGDQPPLRSRRARRRGHRRRGAATVPALRTIGVHRGHSSRCSRTRPRSPTRPATPRSSRSTDPAQAHRGQQRDRRDRLRAADDVTAVIDRAEPMVFEVTQRRTTDSVRWLRELLQQSRRPARGARRGAHHRRRRPASPISTNIVLGLQPSNLTSSAPAPRWARPLRARHPRPRGASCGARHSSSASR